MSRLVYYIVIIPLSKLPLSILYVLSDFIFFILYRIVKYRKEVVWSNVRNSFPNKSAVEIRSIVDGFYRHFSDLMIESLKIFSISEEEAIKRCKILNPEVLDTIYEQGKHAIIVGGHYNNWEMLAVGLNPQVKHHIVGIYAPLSDFFFNTKFSKSRSKLGTGLVAKKEVPRYFADERALSATVFGADQSPAIVKKNTFWMNFLNQDTAVLYGTEKYALQYDLPVVYVGITKVKRGYYEMEFSLIEADPKNSTPFSITEKHTRMLEEQILKDPEFYLWTHKRWKHKKPKNLV